MTASDTPVRPVSAMTSQHMGPVLRGLGGLAALGLGVQLMATWGPEAWQVPDLGELAVQAHRFVVGEPRFVSALVHTVETILLSLLVAVSVGVVVGMTLGLSQAAYRALTLPLELLRPVPAIAVIPVMILALGQGQSMEIAVTALAAWWPILFNTLYGVRNVEPLTIQTARAFGLSRAQVVRRVVLPATLPMIITGLRIAAPLALIVAVGAQYLATAGQGLGGVLIQATSTGDLQVLWAAAVVSGMLGLALGGLTWLLGRVMCPWNTEW